MKTAKVGIIGLGTVGSGTLELILKKQNFFKEKFQIDLQIAGISSKTASEFETYAHINCKKTTQPLELCTDPSIDILVELAGGYDLPKLWISTALEHKKHIVTANKALLAKYGHELFPLAKKMECLLMFEASVGGGIPIIKALQESLIANHVNKLACIINGTCNYILTKMFQQGLEYSDVLQEAQKLGYAEADPTFDVEGIDSAHKVALLSSLCYGKFVNFNSMNIEGISKISKLDVSMAKELGYQIKLLGITSQIKDQITASVYPALLPSDHPLANVHGVLNAVYIDTSEVGPTLLSGAGAGKKATSSAVVSDILTICQHLNQPKQSSYDMAYINKDNEAPLLHLDEQEMEFYIRFTTKDDVGVLAKITQTLANAGISISAIHQREPDQESSASVIVVTHFCRNKVLRDAIEEIDSKDFICAKSQVIRFFQ